MERKGQPNALVFFSFMVCWTDSNKNELDLNIYFSDNLVFFYFF